MLSKVILFLLCVNLAQQFVHVVDANANNRNNVQKNVFLNHVS